jgi:hypothetical protein
MSADIDPAARLAYREHQKAYCSHYASEPRSSWDDRPVTELTDFFWEINELIKRENPK